MKNILIILSILVFAFPNPAQIDCNTSNTLTKINENDSLQLGGKYLTSRGNLKVLVIFAKFMGDTSYHPNWPANSYPSEMDDFIDPDMQKGSTHFLNLTNYYNQMSLGKFRVTGKSIGAETPFPKSHYLQNNQQNPDWSLATADLLKAIDDSVDYREFDNWTYVSDYNLINSPDGIVDMIIVIWRGLVFNDQWSGQCALGGGPEIFVENNQERIRTYYGAYDGFGIQGSGVTLQYWGERSRERNFKCCIHEVAHWLIQKDHPYSEFKHTFWGMLTLGSEGICANSIEREKLGWTNPQQITDTTSVIELGDYITTSSSVKYHPPNGLPNEYFYFENHQKRSIYDDATSNLNDKGIFILQVSDNNCYAGDCLRVLTSDGFWDWSSPSHTDCWGNDLPVFQKKCVNRNGTGNRDKIRVSDSCCSFLYSFVNNNIEIECNDWLHGYGFKNSFDTAFNDVFSSWSNPPAKTWDVQSVDFAMEVISQNGSNLLVKFINKNSLKSKPSKPNLGIDPRKLDNQTNSNIIQLVWGADNRDGLPIEPDIICSELQIKIDSSCWNTIYSGTDRSWNDSNLAYHQFGKVFISFRVRMRDDQNQWSKWSDIYETEKNLNNITSIDEKNPNKLLEWHLYQNYPNPFNNTTIIRYSIPKEGIVTIRIYNILGEEVTTLVNEQKAAGKYETEFNATDLPSGVYFYKLQAGPFLQTRKMILLK
jgi:M6 family metalloprotease-like protein